MTVTTTHLAKRSREQVRNMEADVPYRFNIVNCEKLNSQFNFGKGARAVRHFRDKKRTGSQREDLWAINRERGSLLTWEQSAEPNLLRLVNLRIIASSLITVKLAAAFAVMTYKYGFQ